MYVYSMQNKVMHSAAPCANNGVRENDGGGGGGGGEDTSVQQILMPPDADFLSSFYEQVSTPHLSVMGYRHFDTFYTPIERDSPTPPHTQVFFAPVPLR